MYDKNFDIQQSQSMVKESVDQEGWSQYEKMGLANKVLYAAILLLLTSIGLLYIGFVQYSLFQHYDIIIFLIINGILLLFSIGVIVWSLSQTHQIHSGKIQFNEVLNTFESRLIMTLGSLLLVTVLAHQFFLILNQTQYQNYQNAQNIFTYDQAKLNDQSKSNQLNLQNYLNYFYIATGLNSIVFLLLTFIIFVSFQFCSHINGLRLLIYIVSILLCFLCSVMGYLDNQLEQVPQNIGGISSELKLITKPIIFATFIATTLLIIINYVKYRIGYLVTGSILLVIILVQTFYCGHLLRTISKWNSTDDSLIPVAIINSNKLQEIGCNQKYSFKATKLACSNSIQTLSWEDQNPVQSCLNPNCLQLAKDYFKRFVLKLVAGFLLCTGLSFVLSASSIHLSNRHAGALKLNVIMERILLCLFIILGALVILSVFQSQLIVTKPLIPPIAINPQPHIIAQQDFNLNIIQDTSNCQLITSLLNFHLDNLVFQPNPAICATCDGYVVQFSTTAGGVFIPDQRYQLNPNVWQNSVAVNTQVAAKFEELDNYFKNLYYCPQGKSPLNDASFTLQKPQLITFQTYKDQQIKALSQFKQKQLTQFKMKKNLDKEDNI